MNLAILETGTPPAALIADFGRYPAMFKGLLGEASNIPASTSPPARCRPTSSRHDAYLITGSPAGVYDDLPWIAKLKTFLRAAAGRAKLVGICFGHQIMAEAFGGRVEKSAQGLGRRGSRPTPIVRREPWMDDVSCVAVPASHQDQVVLQPPGAEFWSPPLSPLMRAPWSDQPASASSSTRNSPDYARR